MKISEGIFTNRALLEKIMKEFCTSLGLNESVLMDNPNYSINPMDIDEYNCHLIMKDHGVIIGRVIFRKNNNMISYKILDCSDNVVFTAGPEF
ncbi:MAG TPA: hypothetical protein QF753_20515 [Victivallales bacterium]|nr:hypothetical protein [Victivallales bacterium]